TTSHAAQQPSELDMALECRPEPREVALAERHRPAAGGAVGGVGEADEMLALLGPKQLDHGREPLLAGPLRERDAVDEDGRAPRRRLPLELGCRRHRRQRTGPRRTRLCRLRARSARTPREAEAPATWDSPQRCRATRSS